MTRRLKRMRRFYTAEQFKGIVDAFRAEFPDLTLATDVIVGFPGETAEAFENTLKLLEEVKPDVVNVSKFFARPKTAAAQIQDGLVEREEIKRRSTVAASWLSGFLLSGISVGSAGLAKCLLMRRAKWKVHGWDATLLTNQSPSKAQITCWAKR